MIDIIIPAYNAQSTIEKTLLSICMQSIKDKIKVYIIDDNSDETYDYLEEYFKDKLDITIYRLKEKSGPGVARNKGLEISDSELVMFLDSDDLLINEYSLRSLYYNSDNKDIIIGVEEQELEDGKLLREYDSDRSLHAKLYRRSFLEKYNIKFPELYRHEDCAFHEICLINRPRMQFINEYVYLYTYNRKSLTHKNNKKEDFKNYKDLCDATTYMLNEGKKINGDKVVMIQIIVGTLIYLYYKYQPYHHEDYSSDMFEWIKPLVSYYLNNQKYMREKLLEDDYHNFSYFYDGIPFISWYDFIDKASK